MSQEMLVNIGNSDDVTPPETFVALNPPFNNQTSTEVQFSEILLNDTSPVVLQSHETSKEIRLTSTTTFSSCSSSSDESKIDDQSPIATNFLPSLQFQSRDSLYQSNSSLDTPLLNEVLLEPQQSRKYFHKLFHFIMSFFIFVYLIYFQTSQHIM